ncbi:MAG: response regulator [Myxococcota bacterium]
MAKDLYRYFRIESRELLEGLSAGVLAVEAGAGADVVVRLLRLTHTLKGAARAVRQPDIAEDAHAIEEILLPWRAGGVVPADQIPALLAKVDRIALAIAALDDASVATPGGPGVAGPGVAGPRVAAVSDSAKPAVAPTAPLEERFDTIRIDIAEAEEVLVGVLESASQLSAVRRDLQALDPARRLATALRARLAQRHARAAPHGTSPDTASRDTASPDTTSPDTAALAVATELVERLDDLHRRLEQGLDRTERELIETRDRATRLRLVDASAIFSTITRTARDASTALGRPATLHTAGGGVHLDAHVLVGVRQAMIHLVNNAIAHGIEPARVRSLAGKLPEGRVEVTVEQRGTHALFRCADDGGGVQVNDVRDAAVRRGLLDAEAARAFTFDDAVQLLLRGGISTTPTADAVSGRGVGLDVVRDIAARFEGRVHIRSEAGRGTVVELLVPMTLWSLGVLEVHTGNIVVLLPIEGIRAVAPVADGDIAWSPGGSSVRVEGEVYPLVSLASLFGLSPGPVRRQGRHTVVLLQAGTTRCALEVDRLLGTRRVVMRPLPVLAPVDDIVAGAALDAEGTPNPVLDIAAVVRLAHTGPGLSRGATPARPGPMLVIDDSLTTRMLEQSILESAGYEVDLAVSAEAGLLRARARRYSVFIVDVEMPGMDGFAFVAETRADADLRDIPAILVTSRGSPEDRRRGLAAGAHAYVVKSEFDQEQLLAILRGLVG